MVNVTAPWELEATTVPRGPVTAFEGSISGHVYDEHRLRSRGAALTLTTNGSLAEWDDWLRCLDLNLGKSLPKILQTALQVETKSDADRFQRVV